MLEMFQTMFSYHFMVRALVVGVLVSLCAALISVVCYFIGLCLSYLFSIPAGASVVVVNILAFCLFAAINKARTHRLRA